MKRSRAATCFLLNRRLNIFSVSAKVVIVGSSQSIENYIQIDLAGGLVKIARAPAKVLEDAREFFSNEPSALPLPSSY